MRFRTEVEAALIPYGITDIAFYEIERGLTAIRITDQPYRDHGVVVLIRDILATNHVDCVASASNARYDTDDAIGAVFITRDIEPEWARSYREGQNAASYDEALDYLDAA